MKLSAEQVGHGFILRGWYDEQDGPTDSGAPIDLVAFLKTLSPRHAEVCAAKGELKPRMLLKIGKRARELGYDTLSFHRAAGSRLSWADLVHSADGMDHYQVDLRQAVDASCDPDAGKEHTGGSPFENFPYR